MDSSLHDRFSIRVMSRADIEQAVDWAAAEGWNPGLSDAACFSTVDPAGFIGGWLDDELTASISVINYDDRFSFLGFYIVAPGQRGNGYGYRLWREAIKHAGERLVGLDGVPAEQANYRRSGFELAYRNIRYGGYPSADAVSSGSRIETGVEICPVEGLTADLAEYDCGMFPADRSAFLHSWFNAAGHFSRVAVRSGKLAGYGVIRPCRNGHKIGPLFADDRVVAEALLQGLLDGAGIGKKNSEIFLDIPDVNLAGMDLAGTLGLDPVFETARMYTGKAPAIAVDRVFGVTTFELG